jgi:hypothetical protein
VIAILALWLAVVIALGVNGAYVRAPGSLPLPILIGVIVPIIAFLTMYRVWPAFRRFILSLDLVPVTALQAWRFGGLGFLALYVYGILPGQFAWPAGLGDMAIGASAVWVVWALSRRPQFAASRSFAIWNLLGIFDLVVAVGTGATASGMALGVYGEITTGPMAQMPLVLVPGFLVPCFVMLHLTALFQARGLVLSGGFRQTGFTSPSEPPSASATAEQWS